MCFFRKYYKMKVFPSSMKNVSYDDIWCYFRIYCSGFIRLVGFPPRGLRRLSVSAIYSPLYSVHIHPPAIHPPHVIPLLPFSVSSLHPPLFLAAKLPTTQQAFLQMCARVSSDATAVHPALQLIYVQCGCLCECVSQLASRGKKT